MLYYLNKSRTGFKSEHISVIYLSGMLNFGTLQGPTRSFSVSAGLRLKLLSRSPCYV